jgi:hypothetical protein
LLPFGDNRHFCRNHGGSIAIFPHFSRIKLCIQVEDILLKKIYAAVSPAVIFGSLFVMPAITKLARAHISGRFWLALNQATTLYTL